MKGIILGLGLLLVAAMPAQASRGQIGPRQTFIDVAARPAYEPDVAPAARRFHARHHREGRHEGHPERHAAARRRPVERPSAAPAPSTPRYQPPNTEAVMASALGALLGIPGGWADGMAASIPQSVHDLAYLVARASDESTTIERQTPIVAIGRLVPIFVQRLADTFREVALAGVHPCVQSAYRPPSFGIGGFRDKFRSAHSYGLAVDVCNIDGPGSRDAMLFRKIAARHGVYGPYSVNSRAEFNHFQPTRERLVADAAPLRRTITAEGPKSLEKMWRIAEAIIAPVGLAVAEPEHHGHVHIGHIRYAEHRRHYAEHHHRHYAKA
jgi:hypothetical protein